MIREEKERYDAYLVRIWRDDGRGQWRGQVTPVGGGAVRFFTDPMKLWLYLVGETAVAHPHPPTTQGDESS